MSGRAFLDTNVVVYAFSRGAPHTVPARRLLEQESSINVQVLNEFVDVARRKLKMRWNELHDALRIIGIHTGEPRSLTLAIQRAGLEIAERYNYRIYDALIIAAAADAGCRTLYSEDLAAGQTIKGVRIVNPFG